jgi:hypothetical protein
MPVHYEIDRKRSRIRTACSGLVTFEAVVEHFRTLAIESDLPAPLDVLLDLSTIASAPDARQIQRVAEEIARMPGKIRFGLCAIVAPSDLVFGVGRVLEVRAEESFRAIQVFRDPAAAEAWLDAERARRGPA